MSKSSLGQFYTTNACSFVCGMHVPTNLPIIEPFVGGGDLLSILPADTVVECYDIAPSLSLVRPVCVRDTLMNPPTYGGKFVLTNPPYLARNKAVDKTVFDMYKTNDLYKAFIISIIRDPPVGGIVVIPLNFLSSIRVCDVALRRQFVSVFDITQINMYEYRMFADTSCAIIVIEFALHIGVRVPTVIPMHVYASPTQNSVFVFSLTVDNNYTIGGELYQLPVSSHTITRVVSEDSLDITRINIRCLDNPSGMSILATISNTAHIDRTPNQTARTFITLRISPPIDEDLQVQLVREFNEFITHMREQYHSLFLANYREGKRKRISFDLVYRIFGNLLLPHSWKVHISPCVLLREC